MKQVLIIGAVAVLAAGCASTPTPFDTARATANLEPTKSNRAVGTVTFAERLGKVDIQALGWKSGWRYLPLRDDIASTALFYLDRPTARRPKSPSADDMEVHLGTAPVPDIGATPPRAPRD